MEFMQGAFMNTIVFLMGVCFLLYSILRIYLNYKISRRAKKLDKVFQDKLKILQQDLTKRAENLHESVNLINHEYNEVIRSMANMSDSTKKDLKNKLKEFKEMKEKNKSKQPKPPNKNQPDEPTNRNASPE